MAAPRFSIRLEWKHKGTTRKRSIDVPDGIVPYQQFKGMPITSAYIDADTVDQRAFENCTDLVSLTFSERIHGIGFGAFAGCTALKTVVFEEPASWDAWFGIVGKGTFFDINLKDSPVRDEEIGCFQDCKSLESIELPGDTAHFQYGTFKGCTSLTQLTVWEEQAARMRQEWRSVFPDSRVNTINVLCTKRDPELPMAERQKKQLEDDFFNLKNGIFTTGTEVWRTLMEVRVINVDFDWKRVPAKTEDGEPVVFRRDKSLRRRALDARASQLARANGPTLGWRDSTGRDDNKRTDSIVGLPSLPQEIWDRIVRFATEGNLYNWTSKTHP